MQLALAGVCLLGGAFVALTLRAQRGGLPSNGPQVSQPEQRRDSRPAPRNSGAPAPLTHAVASGGPVTLPRRRIVFLVNARGFGGAIRHSLNIAGELQRLGMTVLLVVPPGAPMVAQARALELPVKELDLGPNVGRWRGFLGTLAYFNPWGRRRSIRRIVALQREQPSTFICPFPREQLLTASIHPLHDVRSVWVVHAPFRYLPHRLLLQRVWIRRAARAEAVVPVSRALGTQLLHAGVPGSHLDVIPNAVALPSPSGIGQTQRMPYLVGTAARLVEDKGIQHLIAALPVILQRHPYARLAIAGTGKYERALRRLVARLGLDDRVSFLGYLPDPLRFLSSLQVLVHPTVDPGEVLPTVILEAFSVGAPVVASAIAGIPDQVINGVTGFITRPGDVAGLARSVGALLDHPEQASAMGTAGQQLVAREFLLGRAGRRFARLLGQVEVQPASERRPTLGNLSTVLLAAVRRRHLLGGSAVVLASKVVSALATAWWTILAARVLLPAEYGDLALAVSLVQIGSYFTDIGVQSVATRELAGVSERQARILLGTVIYLKFILGIAGVGVIFGITSLLPFDVGVSRLVLVLGPGLVFTGLNTLTLVFRVRASYGYLLLIALLSAVAGSVAAYSAYLSRSSAMVFAAVYLGGTVLGGLLTIIIVLIRFHPSLRPRPHQLGIMLRTAFPLGLAAILNIMYYRIDVPLLGLLTSSTQVAIYTSAYRFLDVLTLLPASMQAVALPQMSALYKRSVKSLTIYSQNYLDLAVIGGPTLGLILSASARPALHLLYGGRYDVATPTLQVLAWAGAATLVTNVFVPLMITINKSRAMVAVTLIGLAVNLGLNLLLIPRFGPLGSAYATLATEIAVIVAMSTISLSTLRWRVRIEVIVGIAIAIVAVQWVQSRPEFAGEPWLLSLLLLLALWGVLIAIIVFAAWLGRGRRLRRTTEGPA
jgi:O-antigen/teichoic acid export membrane protein/glycosyltransferase involved in cell wall biosynthesis